MARLKDEQLAPIKAELARDGFLGTVSSRALLADLEEAREALRRTQWVYDSFCPGGSVPMGMLCPVCGNHRPEGHKADCVVGNALGGSEQSS